MTSTPPASGGDKRDHADDSDDPRDPLSDLHLVNVVAVHRNFQRTGHTVNAILEELRRMDRRMAEIDRLLAGNRADGVDGEVALLRSKCQQLELRNSDLEGRVRQLEQLLGAASSSDAAPAGGEAAEPSERDDGAVHGIAHRLAQLEAACDTDRRINAASTSELRSSVQSLHAIVAALKDKEYDTSRFALRDDVQRFQESVQAELVAADQSMRSLSALLGTATQRVDAAESRISEFDALKLPEAVERIGTAEQRLDDGERATNDLRDAHGARLTLLEEAVARLRRMSDQLSADLQDADQRHSDDRDRLQKRLDRLAASTARSLRALELTLEALRMKTASAAVSDPLLQRKPCLSCDPTTAVHPEDRAAKRPESTSSSQAKAGAPHTARTPTRPVAAARTVRPKSAKHPRADGAPPAALAYGDDGDDSGSGGISPY